MQKILDQLANGVIDGPDDLIGIGECLNLLDDLEKAGPAKPVLESVGNARVIFKRLVLEESADRNSDWRQIQKILGHIQTGGSGDQPELEQAAGEPSASNGSFRS